ncbi:D-alanine--D-alanine ligase [Planctomicrobium sp. SH661]|uniref:D-alanine--D-alanine ligase n=1 Tax=Planctomicrobium sp. SH661 TaxID=3448124 RepID=UPI003F5CA6CB
MALSTRQQLRNSPPWQIVVLLGGDSAEREISLQSGAAVAAALRDAGHRVELLDPRDQDPARFDWTGTDVAFIALHGTHGEDGQIQQVFDSLKIPYTSSGADASWLAFHKLAAKQRFLQAGLRTPEYRVVKRDTPLSTMNALADELRYPLVVKPEAQGSSLGVSILTSPEQLNDAVAKAMELDDTILLETAIPGQEWTVPVLDDVALPAIRIGTAHTFFDYEAKYLDDNTRYEVVTDCDDPIARAVQSLSLSASQSLGCCGVSRVDLRVDPAGDAWLLEVNTVPGMTDHSLVPKSALAHGWSMSQLCEEIIRSALR